MIYKGVRVNTGNYSLMSKGGATRGSHHRKGKLRHEHQHLVEFGNKYMYICSVLCTITHVHVYDLVLCEGDSTWNYTYIIHVYTYTCPTSSFWSICLIPHEVCYPLSSHCYGLTHCTIWHIATKNNRALMFPPLVKVN